MAGLQLAEEEAGDEEPADHEKDVNADIAAPHGGKAQMIEDHREDGERTNAVDVWPIVRSPHEVRPGGSGKSRYGKAGTEIHRASGVERLSAREVVKGRWQRDAGFITATYPLNLGESCADRAESTRGVASPTLPGWNQIAGFLESMRELRASSGFAA